MWLLLKSGLSYTKYALMFSYGICIIVMAGLAYTSDSDIYSYMGSTTLGFFITMGIIGAGADSEKATRFNAMLPLRPRDVALADLLYLVVFQLGMVLLWIALLAIKPEMFTRQAFWSMLSQNGLTLGGIMLFVIHTHLGFYETRTYQRLSYALSFSAALLIAGLIYFRQMDDVVGFLWRHYVSASGAIVSTALWLGLSYASVIVYVRRRSYLA